MPELFADTSGWGNLFRPTQPYHALAASRFRGARQRGARVVTTNYVMAELVALLTSPLPTPRPLVVSLIEGLLTSTFVEIVHVDPVLHAEGWQLLKNRLDKHWSLVDCVSFVLMKRRGILEAMTADHHFEQAGFVRLLK